MAFRKKVLSLLLTAALLLALCPAVAAEDPFFIENGVLVEYRGSASSVAVPTGVHTIGFGAFTGGTDSYSVNETLVTLTLPDSVTTIESWAFANSTSLKNVTLSQNLAAIEDGAFFGCTSLKKLALPQSLRTIGGEAFRDCIALTDMQIPSGVTEIGYNSIRPEHCKKVGDFYMAGDGILMYYMGMAQDLVIPDSVKAIHPQLYARNYEGGMALRSVVVPGSVKTIGYEFGGNGAFDQLTNLTSVTLGEGLTYLGPNTFWGCKSLRELTLPSTLKQVGNGAFGEPLQEQEHPLGPNRSGGYIPWLDARGEEFVVAGDGVLIKYNGNSENIVVPEGVKAIGGGVFSHWLDIMLGIHAPKVQPVSVTLPQSLTDIGSNAFSECTALSSINLPSGLRKLGMHAFSGCGSLPSVTVPDGVTELPASVFASCSSLSSVTLPKGLTRIGEQAFADCSELSRLTLPGGLKEIGRSAFSGDYQMGPMVLPAGLELVEQYPFPKSESFTLTVLGQNTRFLYGALTIDENWPYSVYAPRDSSVRRAALYPLPNGSVDSNILIKDLLTAQPSSTRIVINGEEVPFDAYLIEENNYFKLRDLAMAFNGKRTAFHVEWDGLRGAVTLLQQTPYTPVGGELTPGDGMPKQAIPSTAPIYFDDAPLMAKAYLIGNNNYVMLRDVLLLLGADLEWDASSNTVFIDAGEV